MQNLEEVKEWVDDDVFHSLKQFFAFCPQTVMDSMRLVKFKKNHNLISTYQDSKYVYVLLQGVLQAIEERVVDIPYSFTDVTPFDIVGDYELFTGMEGHYVTLKTMTPATCLQLPAAMYLYWIRKDADALFLRTQMLMKDLSVQTQQQRQYLFMNNRTRLMLYLHRRALAQGSDRTLPDTRERIAAQIGCSVRSLNRILHAMAEQDMLSITHGKLHLSTHQHQRIITELEKADIQK